MGSLNRGHALGKGGFYPATPQRSTSYTPIRQATPSLALHGRAPGPALKRSGLRDEPKLPHTRRRDACAAGSQNPRRGLRCCSLARPLVLSIGAAARSPPLLIVRSTGRGVRAGRAGTQWLGFRSAPTTRNRGTGNRRRAQRPQKSSPAEQRVDLGQVSYNSLRSSSLRRREVGIESARPADLDRAPAERVRGDEVLFGVVRYVRA